MRITKKIEFISADEVAGIVCKARLVAVNEQVTLRAPSISAARAEGYGAGLEAGRQEATVMVQTSVGTILEAAMAKACTFEELRGQVKGLLGALKHRAK